MNTQVGSFSLDTSPGNGGAHVQDTSSRLDLPSLNNSTQACSILRALSPE